MSPPNPLVAAAAPSLISILTALQTFLTNLGTDPTKIPLTAPGALQVFLGTVEMQLPALATSEFTALQTAANAKIAGWIAQVEKAA